MQYFLGKEFIQNLKEKIKKAERIFLFLDFDGTLTSIQKTPDLALLSSSTRKILQSLSSFPQIILTIISGRALEEIKKLVSLETLNYVGNHGLEIKTRSFQDKIPQSRNIRKKMASFYQKIKKRTWRFLGILIENKGLTLSIHYRLVEKDNIPELKKEVDLLISSFKRSYELREGKKVLEIRPRTKRNKGWAVNMIIRQYSSRKKLRDLYFYFGDDLTDEDAFELTNSKGGYSILVDRGCRDSQAHYYLKGPEEVRLFLGWLKEKTIKKY